MKMKNIFNKISKYKLYVLLFFILILMSVLTSFTVSYYTEKVPKFNNFQDYTGHIGSIYDAAHYNELALKGYNKNDEPFFAFFPLFPLEIRLISYITRTNIYTSSVLVVFINFILLITILYKFANKFLILEKIDISRKKLLFLILIFPFTSFFLVPYTESLYFVFLFLIFYILFFVKYQSKLFLILPILTFLIALTRNIAVVLIPILILYTLFDGDFIKTKKIDISKKISVIYVSVLTLVLGFLSFSYFGYRHTGDFFISSNAQKYWDRDFSLNVFKPLYEHLIVFFDKSKFVEICPSLSSCSISFFYETIAFIIFIITLVLGWKYFSKHIEVKILLLYSFIVGLLPLFSGSLMSYNRFLILIPSYILLLPILIIKKLPTFLFYILMTFLFIFQFILIALFTMNFWTG